MTFRAALAAALVTFASGTTSPQPPAFSTRVDAVRVDVLVTEGGRLVRGLTASDFEVRDNGVPQQVDLLTFERLPLNVVLALDVSDSVTAERLADLRAAGAAIVDHLKPDDQTALITFSEVVTLDSPLTRDRSRTRRALDAARAIGRTSLIDATYAGIVVGEGDRDRSLLIVFTDGVDTSSWLSAEAVLDIARRSDVVVYGVSAGRTRKHGFADSITALTGGSLFAVESTRDLSATFLRILDEFRHRYLLSYTPRGVSRGGWHRLQVRVKGHSYSVRARAGYHGRS